MAEPKKCSACGAELRSDAPIGHCPQCLLAMGLGAHPDEQQTAETTAMFVESIRYFGDYELIDLIARGGMGTVYRARQTSLNRLVALKLINAGALVTEDLIKRFKAEAESAASLTHPNIVPIFEIGQHEGEQYFTMGLIEGCSLSEKLRSLRLGGGTRHMSLRDCAHLVATIARAVHYAHQHGVLHRDIKPSNILLDTGGQPHLTDFGLAKLIEKESTLTHTNAVMGTPAYMSPEQACGESKNVTTATDVYGLGAVLYETLTGAPPFAGGTSMETIRQVIDQEPRRPSLLNAAVDRDLETICLKCLEKEPERRYASAEALAEDLTRWLGSEPIAARSITVYERVRKWVRRRPAIAALGTLSLLSLVALAIGSTTAAFQITSAKNSLRENLYAADMGLAFQAWESDRAQYSRELLEKWRPEGQKDLRNFEWRYLYGLTRPSETFVFRTKSADVWGSALSPNNRFLATAGSDARIHIWDFENRRLITTLEVPPSLIYGVAFSPDGSTMASSMASHIHDANGQIYLWDGLTFQVRRILRGHREMSTGMVFSPDSQRVASVSGWPYNPMEVGQIFLWDVASGRQRLELKGHNTSVGPGVSFSPDGKLLATPHGDGLIRIWDTETGRIVQTLEGHPGLVFAVKFSPDGTQLASGGIDGSVRLWGPARCSTGEMIGRHSGPVYAIAFSPDGKRLISGGRDSTARLWDVNRREETKRFRGHSDRIFSVSFAGNGGQVVTGSSDGTARLWNVDGADNGSYESFPYPGAGACLISPDSRWIIWGGSFWRLNGMAEICKVTGGLWSFAPDGEQFITQGADGFQVWKLDGEKPEHVRVVTTRTNLTDIWPSFAPDGKKVSLVCGRSNVVVWSTTSWEELGSVHEPGLEILAQAFSTDGKWLATAHRGGRLLLWNSKDLSRGPELTGHRADIRNLTFSADGRWLATASMDRTVRLWDLDSLRSRAFWGDSGWLSSVAFSPDGRTLAAGTNNGEIKLWNVATGREVMTLKGHATSVGAVEFSRDGRVLASTGGEVLRLWHAPKFQEAEEKHPANGAGNLEAMK